MKPRIRHLRGAVAVVAANSCAETGEVGYDSGKEKRMQPLAEKPIWWRIVVGSLLVILEVKNHIAPAPNLLKASNEGEQVGMYVVMVAIIVL